MIEISNGGQVSAIPEGDDDLLTVTVRSEIGDAVVKVTPAEARLFGAAFLGWGMRQGYAAAARQMSRAAVALAKALDQSERIAP